MTYKLKTGKEQILGIWKMMNSTNWPAPNVWFFIAQLVEHCSDNAEAMGSNPLEAPDFFLVW